MHDLIDAFDNISEFVGTTDVTKPIQHPSPQKKRRTMVAPKTRSHVSAASTNSSAIGTTETTRQLPTMRESINPSEEPISRMTPAPSSEIEDANGSLEPTGTVHPQRRTNGQKKPKCAVSAAPIPSDTTDDRPMLSMKSKKCMAGLTNGDDKPPVKPMPVLRSRHSDRQALDTQNANVTAATNSDGHPTVDTHSSNAIGGDDEVHAKDVNHASVSPIIANIRQTFRLRQRWHRAEKSLILQGKAACRAYTDGDKTAANALYDLEPHEQPVEVAMMLMPFKGAIETFRPLREKLEDDLKEMAMTLPAAEWVKSTHGFGEGNFAYIVGCAGDIGSYRTPACLWKRMGLAVIDGKRQRKIADLEQAFIHGYSPSRRSVAWMLGKSLRWAAKNCPYTLLYEATLAKELAREDAGKPASDVHARKRAARRITKEALKDLWIAWRAADRNHLEGVTHLDKSPSWTPEFKCLGRNLVGTAPVGRRIPS